MTKNEGWNCHIFSLFSKKKIPKATISDLGDDFILQRVEVLSIAE